MIPLRMASISGFNGPRGSLFQGSTTDIFGLGESPYLGQRNAQQWYDYAKREVRQYDELIVRARKIANKAARDQIIRTYYGDPADQSGALYRRNSVAANIANAESYTPINYVIYQQDQAQNRVEKLNDWNKDLGAAVKYAEDYYGVLPNPQVIETTTTVSETPGWVTPVVIGALGLGALSLLGVFGGK